MLVLFETAAGYALFKTKNNKLSAGDMFEDFKTPELASNAVKLKSFSKFADTTEALAGACAAVEGKMSKGLKNFLKTNIIDAGIKEELAVHDPKV